MTDARRPAAASRILAGAVSTAAMFGLTAQLAATAPPSTAAVVASAAAGPAATTGASSPQQVVVVVRRHRVDSRASQAVSQAPVLVDVAPQPAPPTSQPPADTTSSGS